MSYVIKRCSVCDKEYHIHSNGKTTGACEHIKVGRIKGKRTVVETADVNELDEMIEAGKKSG